MIQIKLASFMVDIPQILEVKGKNWLTDLCFAASTFFPKGTQLNYNYTKSFIELNISSYCIADTHTLSAVKICILNFLLKTETFFLFFVPNIYITLEYNRLIYKGELPPILPIPEGNSIKQINECNFPEEEVPSLLCCPISQRIMSLPVFLAERPENVYDHASLVLHLWLKNTDPLTNEVLSRAIFTLHNGFINLIDTYLAKIKMLNTKDQDVYRYHLSKLNEVCSIGKFQKEIGITDIQNNQTPNPEKKVQDGISAICKNDLLTGIDEISTNLSLIENNLNKDLLVQSYFSLATAYYSLLKKVEGKKNIRLFLANFTSEFYLSTKMDIQPLVESLLGANEKRLALIVLKRLQSITKEIKLDDKLLIQEIKSNISFFQHGIGMENLRKKTYKGHGFSQFVNRCQESYKLRSQLRTKFFNSIPGNLLPFYSKNLIEKIICKDKLTMQEREDEILDLLVNKLHL